MCIELFSTLYLTDIALPPRTTTTTATLQNKTHHQVGINVPLVVRLEGTNVEAGKQILRGSPLKIIAADDLDDAAKKAVASLA
jgi:succinyl-CoA synthetase beta subunit